MSSLRIKSSSLKIFRLGQLPAWRVSQIHYQKWANTPTFSHQPNRRQWESDRWKYLKVKQVEHDGVSFRHFIFVYEWWIIFMLDRSSTGDKRLITGKRGWGRWIRGVQRPQVEPRGWERAAPSSGPRTQTPTADDTAPHNGAKTSTSVLACVPADDNQH